MQNNITFQNDDKLVINNNTTITVVIKRCNGCMYHRVDDSCVKLQRKLIAAELRDVIPTSCPLKMFK